jgi:signal transduction histidine kinase
MSTSFTADEAQEIGRRALVHVERQLVPRPLSAGLYLLVNFALGVGWFIVLVTLLSAGAALTITLIGIPILVMTLFLWMAGARWERGRLGAISGQRIPEPYRRMQDGSHFRRAKSLVTDPAVWRDLVYLFALFPLGILELVIVSIAVGIPVMLVMLPTYFWIGGGADIIFGWHVETFAEALIGVVLGFILTVPMLLMISGTARAHIAFGRWLLGPSQEQLEERVEVLTRTRSGVMEAMLEERRRIERDLHDGAQQRLVALAMDLGMAKEKLKTDPEAARVLVESSHEEAKRVLTELRELVRGIHPAVLTDRGLDAAISAVAGRSPIPITVDVRLNGRLPEAIESTAYFVVVEALANVAKHSRATKARVRITRQKDWLLIDIEDDGTGGVDPRAGTGLTGLAERLAALDGRLSISIPVTGGTALRAEIPCGS